MFFSKSNIPRREVERYGFKSRKQAPPDKDLKAFEDELIGLVQKVETRYFSNPLQERMKEDIKKIKECNKMIVPADKTANLYCMEVQQYKDELRNNITKDYKVSRTDVLKSINSESAVIAERLELSDRVEAIAEKPANITVKDHKPDFPARLGCRLINP